MVSPEGSNRAEGLLEQIADTALDDDYYVVRSGPSGGARGYNTALTAFALGIFALLVTIAVIQTRTDRPASEAERATLIKDVEARKELRNYRDKVASDLRAEVAALSREVVGATPDFSDVGLRAADTPVAGPGIRVQVTPNPESEFGGQIRDADLRILVNGLWYAGAEAIAVNGNRIGSMSAIRTAEGVVKVNFKRIVPPYVVEALGDSNSLAERFESNPAGVYWENRRVSAGVGVSVTKSSELAFAAVPKSRLSISVAHVIEENE
jgi:uncharacterized protein YlxW (UPF0749 family)